MRVVVADSRNLVRAGIRRLLEEQADVEVVGEAADGPSLLDAVARLRPDVAFSEIALNGRTGLQILGDIRERFPQTAVVFISSRTDRDHLVSALRLGAAGFVDKDAEPGELALALDGVRHGRIYLSPSISYGAAESRRTVPARPGDDVSLTPRQREVLKLMAQGQSTREIARAIGISIKTVETHRARMMHALGLHGTHALMRYAIRSSLDYAYI